MKFSAQTIFKRDLFISKCYAFENSGVNRSLLCSEKRKEQRSKILSDLKTI